MSNDDKVVDDDTTRIITDEELRKSRGAQLRALIFAWYTNDTFQRALQEQALAFQEGTLEISDDWSDIADSIYSSFTTQMKLLKQ